jgi:hypothetical protein
MSLTAYCHDIYGIATLALWITQNKSRVYAYVCINKKFQEGTCFSLSEAQLSLFLSLKNQSILRVCM